MQKWIAFLSTILCWYSITAQPANASFLHYTTDQGLSNDHITSVVKDHLGFLWISTVNGLNRFNGRTFTVFRHDPADPNSIIEDDIRSLSIAPDGWLWLASNKGLCKLDPKSLTIKRITLPENADSLDNDVATQVVFDSKGNAWTSTINGLYRINPKRDQQDYFYKTDESLGWYGAIMDRHDQMWLMKDDVRRFDTNTKTLKTFGGTHQDVSLHQGGVLSLVEDSSGEIWAGTWGFGIWHYDRTIDDFTRQSPTLTLAMMLLPDYLPSGKQFFWVGGGKSGLAIYYPYTNEYTEFIPDPRDPFTHNNYLATHFFKDKTTGDVWIGTEVGLEHYAPATIRFGRAIIPPENDMGQFSLVSGVVQDNTDPTGQNYFLTVWGAGLFTWNKNTGKFTRLKSNTSFTGGGNFNLLQDSNGELWGSMNHGIGRYNPKTGVWKDYKNFFQYNERNNLSWNGLEDSKGNLWFCTNKEGLFKYNRLTDQMEPAFNQSEFLDEKGILNVLDISEDQQGRLWLACNASGLIRFDPVTSHADRFTYRGLTTPLICNAVEVANSGLIYVGFYTDFLEIDQEGKVLRHFNQQNGLKTTRMFFLLEDRQGKLWFNSSYLLHCFDPVTGTFTYYGKPDGLFSNIITDGLSITSSGEIFVGFQNAFNFFYPDLLKRNVQPPPIAITSIKVMNEERKLTTSKQDTFLRLRPGEDFFEIEFAALNFNQQERNQYAYYLEGFNKSWVYTDRPVATFTNLDGGEYTLHMKASNNDGVWNDNGITLSIRVNPSFYKTRWFPLTIALILGALSVGFFWYRRQQRLRLEKFREVLARDLHDEMGSTLSSIRFFSEFADQQMGNDKPTVKPVLQRISQSATNLSESMQDIIWAMKAENDQLEDLAAHMTEFGLRMLESRNVKFKTTISDDFAGRHLRPEQRRNIYLIFKEAIHNAAKYSGATEVELTCTIKKGILDMKITDNGKGFEMMDTPAEGSGYGIQNMHQRAKDIGGQLEIVSKPGEGTSLELKVQV